MFKVTKFQMITCDHFLKDKHKGANLTYGVPKAGLHRSMQISHFRLLLHFIGQMPLDIPYYFYRSMGNMVEKAQPQGQEIDPYIFHFGLINMLLLYGLKKLWREWNNFLFLVVYEPKSMKSTLVKVVIHDKGKRKEPE